MSNVSFFQKLQLEFAEPNCIIRTNSAFLKTLNTLSHFALKFRAVNVIPHCHSLDFVLITQLGLYASWDWLKSYALKKIEK